VVCPRRAAERPALRSAARVVAGSPRRIGAAALAGAERDRAVWYESHVASEAVAGLRQYAGEPSGVAGSGVLEAHLAGFHRHHAQFGEGAGDWLE
jgi:hypothetical protein